MAESIAAALGASRCATDDRDPEWTAQRMVFVTDGEPALWVVENPEALEGYEGKHVRISGQLDSDNLTVRVSKTTPIDKENQVR